MNDWKLMHFTRNCWCYFHKLDGFLFPSSSSFLFTLMHAWSVYDVIKKILKCIHFQSKIYETREEKKRSAKWTFFVFNWRRKIKWKEYMQIETARERERKKNFVFLICFEIESNGKDHDIDEKKYVRWKINL